MFSVYQTQFFESYPKWHYVYNWKNLKQDK